MIAHARPRQLVFDWFAAPPLPRRTASDPRRFVPFTQRQTAAELTRRGLPIGRHDVARIEREALAKIAADPELQKIAALLVSLRSN